ncbi:phage major tail tube protein [Sporosarcina sp. P33]|uniref:phage major tail tube protein n=1 Tax=Sporosarcina sp. P33 TaxID=1930764 RepID=UPI0009C17CDC|nr:phage major tail tube protein [Sporosarcina sp. P33]ARD47574.1 phage tail protein [Sporosarcina sp. P33]
MANKISEKLTNFSAYAEGDRWLGITDVELPSLDAMTETLSGAGINGELDMPVIGHYGSMTVKLNWRTLGPEAIELAEQRVHALDFRGSQQVFNAGAGVYEHQPVKVTIRAIPKTTTPGKFEPGSTTGTGNELECTYIKKEIDGKRVLEIDKLNFISFVNGKDELEQVRKNLGM